MNEEISATDRMMLEGLYWWDIPSLFHCPIERDRVPLDIAPVELKTRIVFVLSKN